MADINVDDVVAALENTRVSPCGVTFEGRSLKLNTAEDAKVVTDAIENCNNLQYLNLEGNTLGVGASEVIAIALQTHPEFKRALWKDMFTGRMKTEIPKALEFLGRGLVTARARLTVLDLSDNAFGPIGVEGLASLLRSSSCYALEELRLNNNGLGITGGRLLAKALLDCYNASKMEMKPLSLKVFIAGRNRLENEGAKALAEVFKTLGSLEEVVMPQNGIYHRGIHSLSKALIQNTNLQILNLNDNTIGPRGSKHIANVLPMLQHLKEINFGDCLLKTQGALHLAKGLEKGHVELQELILSSNEISSTGGLALAGAMANKKKMKNLELDGNKFGTAGRNELKTKLKAIGKLNILGSLDDDESEDDDEDEEEEIGETDEETDSDVDGWANISHNPNVDTLVNVLESISTSPSIDFVTMPSLENLSKMGDNAAQLVIQELKKSPENYAENIVAVIMKVSTLAKDERAKTHATNCVNALYKELFSWAQSNNKVSIVNDSLLVHLGLIKSEDKNFKPTWNIGACISQLESVVNQNYIPQSTKDALKVFMGRDVERNADYAMAKKNILSILNQA